MEKKIVKILLYCTVVYPLWKLIKLLKELIDFEVVDLGSTTYNEKSEYKSLKSEYKQ